MKHDMIKAMKYMNGALMVIAEIEDEYLRLRNKKQEEGLDEKEQAQFEVFKHLFNLYMDGE